jgi:hypothetical protein
MDNSRRLNVDKPITLAKFLKELSLQRVAEIRQMSIEDLISFKRKAKTITIYDRIGNEIYDSDTTGTLISDFELFEHLDDEVKKAYETEHAEYSWIEIFLK